MGPAIQRFPLTTAQNELLSRTQVESQRADRKFFCLGNVVEFCFLKPAPWNMASGTIEKTYNVQQFPIIPRTDVGSVSYEAKAGVVIVRINHATVTTNTWYTVATLPESVRPASIVTGVCGYGAYGATPGGMRVLDNGHVDIGIVATSETIAGVWGELVYTL